LIKNCNLLFTRSLFRTSKLQEKPSVLKREHPALQKIKCAIFVGHFALLNPNPGTPLNLEPIRSGSRSTTLISRQSYIRQLVPLMKNPWFLFYDKSLFGFLVVSTLGLWFFEDILSTASNILQIIFRRIDWPRKY
jgi:hypothetical protein